MKHIILLLPLFVLLTACEKEFYNISDIDQDVLLKIEYNNMAWGIQHRISLIEKTGSVRIYNLPESWNYPDTDGYITLSELNENLDRESEPACTLDTDDILKYFNKLYKVDPEDLTKPLNTANDAGITRFSGYILDNKSNKYREVLLWQTGDYTIENRSREAKQIFEWLQGLCR